jgi:hypothetical protein
LNPRGHEFLTRERVLDGPSIQFESTLYPIGICINPFLIHVNSQMILGKGAKIPRSGNAIIDLDRAIMKCFDERGIRELWVQDGGCKKLDLQWIEA